METIEKTFINSLLQENHTFKEISEILKQRYPGVRGFSLRSVQRYCHDNGLTRRISQNAVNEIVSDAVKKVNIVLIISHFYSILVHFSVCLSTRVV